MDFELKGKAAVVSGSTAGIGFAIATALAAEGASVVINGRTEARVTAALEQIRTAVEGAELTGVAADLGTAAGVETFLNAVPETDILVNNLGIFEVKPFAEITDADWLRFFEVNVLSGVRLARHYLPMMRDKNWGRVIFVSSESAVNIPVEMIHYGMTKTASADRLFDAGILGQHRLGGPADDRRHRHRARASPAQRPRRPAGDRLGDQRDHAGRGVAAA